MGIIHFFYRLSLIFLIGLGVYKIFFKFFKIDDLLSFTLLLIISCFMITLGTWFLKGG